jgi:DNA-binding response OmpR family regulator
VNSKPREALPRAEILINVCSASPELRARMQLLTKTEEGVEVLSSTEASRDPSIDIYLIPVSLLSFVDTIQSFSSKPVIAHGPAAGLASAFRRGCRDYLKVPWDEHELLLRTHRFCGPSRVDYPWGRIELDHHLCRGPCGAVLLRPGEEKILRTLICRRGEVVSRRLLLNLLDPELDGESRAVDIHISLLRKKMHRILPSRVRTLILTARPHGYMLR